MHWTNSSLGRTIDFYPRAAIAEPLERRVLMSVVNVTKIADSGNGSLRAAINTANANTTTFTTIRFDLPSGVQTIEPLSVLPAITGEVDIQGKTDSSSDPLIELDGSKAGAGASGLTFNRASSSDTKPSTVSGLIIDRFSSNGISIAGNAPTDVFGCRIGTDSTGEHAHPNGGDGILVNTVACQIGQAGKGPAFQNLISGNGSNGVETGASGADCTIVNCLIGTDAKGISARPNGDDGIVVGAAFATIGGRRAHAGNVISGNSGNGVLINFGNDDILGNLIGTNAAGTAAVPNSRDGINLESVVNVSIGDSTAAGQNLLSGNDGDGVDMSNSSQCTINKNLIGTDITGDQIIADGLDGVQLLSASSSDVIENCVIGGCDIGVETQVASDLSIMSCHIGVSADLKHAIPNFEDGIDLFQTPGSTIESNTIADNSVDSVVLSDHASVGDRIVQNSIFSNGGLGIDLFDGNETPLPNHSGNVAGPNDDQNYPVLSSAIETNGVTLIGGTLSSVASTDFLVEFFANDAADPSGFGEGQTFIGSTGVTTDGNGNKSFSFSAGPATFGQVITATAISTGGHAGTTDGDTSEFSQAIKVTGASITGTVFNDANSNGVQDAGEKGLGGRTVFVDSDNDGLFDNVSDVSAVTNSSGHFRIFGVSAGTYRLRLLGTAGWQQTFPAPKKAYQDVSVAALGSVGGVLFGQEKSTAKAAALAIDVGSGSAYIDHSGQTFAAGNAQQQQEFITFPVAGTDDDPLYYFLDSGSTLNYSYAVPNGKYTLKLFFVDPASTAAGQRTFNVIANGTTVLKHFDIFAAAGAISTAVNESIPLTISGKTLSLEFKGVVGNATISAFELIPA